MDEGTADPRQRTRVAKRRRRELAPQLESYARIGTVLWPFVTATSTPGFTSPHVTIDRRGHRVTALDGREARSDEPPDGAAFLLGGSYAFGVGAARDGGTLAAALWRRTGVPYVNLGVRAGNSTQEVAAALPFADRTTTFVVASGVNNLARVALGGRGLDPLLGPTIADKYLKVLTRLPLRTLSELAESRLAGASTEELVAELDRRTGGRRTRGRDRPVKAASAASSGKVQAKHSPEEAAEHVAGAAARTIRDLRLLRRMVPDDAGVIFALQPFAPVVDKEWSPEEEELFALLDEVQGTKWRRLKGALFAQWHDYAAALERGCASLGVPFVDLSHARYEGWCFIDRVHQTDLGYDCAAAAIAGLLGGSTGLAPHAFALAVAATAGDDAGDDGLLVTEDDPNVYPLW